MKKYTLSFLLFLAVTISGTITVQAIDHHLKAKVSSSEKAQKGPVYYVKIGDTISLLKDPQGYITAATRLGMDTIKVVPDKSGKWYRTVSLDLNQSDEDLKKAIEVKVSEIIVK